MSLARPRAALRASGPARCPRAVARKPARRAAARCAAGEAQRLASRRDASLALLALSLCVAPAQRAEAASALAQQREFDLLVLLDSQKEREAQIAAGEVQRGQDDVLLEAEVRNVREEIKAIQANEEYCRAAKARLDAGEERFLKRLTLQVPDVGAAAKCLQEGFNFGLVSEGDESAVLSFGEEAFGADNGAHFAVRLVKAGGASAAAAQGEASLRYMQLMLPRPLRLSILDNFGCKFPFTYGWLQTQTAFGLVVNSYVGRRRDPVELVALTVRDVPAAVTSLKALGMVAMPTIRGTDRSAGSQYRPQPPPGSVTLRWGGNGEGSGSAESEVTKLLLCPEDAEHKVGEGPALFLGLDALGADGGDLGAGAAAEMLGLRLSGREAYEAALDKGANDA